MWTSPVGSPCAVENFARRLHPDMTEQPSPSPAPAKGSSPPTRRMRLPASRGGLTWLVVLLIVGAFLAVQLGRQVYVNWQTTQAAEEIRQEISALDAQNEELRRAIAYFESDAYISQEARRLTNLGAAGERVLIIPPGAEVAPPRDIQDLVAPKPLLEQWLDLFFGA